MNNEIKIPKKRRRAASLDKRKARSGYFFVAPFIIGIIFIYIPILIDSLWITFWDVEPPNPTNNFPGSMEFRGNGGFELYVNALKEQEFITALLGGLQEILLQVPAIIIFSLFIAVVLNQKMLGRALFRAIFFVPVIISTGIIDTINHLEGNMGTDTVNPDMGAGESGGANQIISVLDVEKLFGSMKVGGQLVAYVVDLVNSIYQIINYSGVQMLIFLAGLQSISPSIYEACRIDGATGWETFWKVTFPMISPMILVNAVYTVIDAFTRTTNKAMVHINDRFMQFAREEATAKSWIYFLIVILIIAIVAGIVSTFIFYQRKD